MVSLRISHRNIAMYPNSRWYNLWLAKCRSSMADPNTRIEDELHGNPQVLQLYLHLLLAVEFFFFTIRLEKTFLPSILPSLRLFSLNNTIISYMTLPVFIPILWKHIANLDLLTLKAILTSLQQTHCFNCFHKSTFFF